VVEGYGRHPPVPAGITPQVQAQVGDPLRGPDAQPLRDTGTRLYGPTEEPRATRRPKRARAIKTAVVKITGQELNLLARHQIEEARAARRGCGQQPSVGMKGEIVEPLGPPGRRALEAPSLLPAGHAQGQVPVAGTLRPEPAIVRAEAQLRRAGEAKEQ